MSRSPIALATIAPATAESTPPDRPQIARPVSPIWARTRSTCSSAMLPMVQVGAHLAMFQRKCSRMRWPCSECITSGCHCTPAKPASTFSNAATGVPSVLARTENPSGAWETESPCDIQTLCWAGMPSRSTPCSPMLTGVRPYSRAPLLSTVPPSPRAISWKP